MVNQECHLNYIPANATNKIVTWTSSNPDIAEPQWVGTGACRVIAKKEGTAVFTATSEDGGHTDTITIHVRPKAAVQRVCLHQNKEVRDRVEASSTENGYSGDTYCLDCGEKIKEGFLIMAQETWLRYNQIFQTEIYRKECV